MKKFNVGDKVWIYENNHAKAFPAVISEVNSLGFSSCYRATNSGRVAPDRVFIDGYIYESKELAIDAMRQVAFDLNYHADEMEQYEVCPGCGCDPEDEHEEHCEVYLEKMRERAEHMADLMNDR